jgi:hypothetical protein
MTTRDHDDLRDASVDAAWRAASHEKPPRALDDAIRAAARRDIGAGPRSSDARAPEDVPQSLRPERWWWPLAAAATIGVVAIGILQLVEPEHVVAPAGISTVVADTPSVPESTKQEVNPAPTIGPMSASLDVPQVKPALSPLPPPPTKEQRAKPTNPASAHAPTATAAPVRAPASALRKDVATPFPREESAQNVAATPPAAAARTQPTTIASMPPAPVEGNAATPASAPRTAAEPFPADKLERESKEVAKTDAGSVAGAAAESVPPATRSEPPREAQVTYSPSGTRPVNASKQRSLDSMTAIKEPPRDARAFAQGRSSAEQLAAPRAKVAPKLSVPDWIALIRKLRDEGNIDEAAKELATFRETYADPDTLLPPDLRDWKPAR